jgi:oligopeptide/dipeptide ABC transporter ATP-binding protein
MGNLVEVKSLSKSFFLPGRKVLKAVDGLDFSIREGETLGLVGESGCGKSTTGRLLLRLIERTSGSVEFEGVNLFGLKAKALREVRRRMQIIFQDPYSSLSPRMTVGKALEYPLMTYGVGRKERAWKSARLLEMVRINPSYANRYPHAFSGGELQRIGIARAMALDPAFLVCDEPVSSLDVSIQSQVLNLLKELQGEKGLTYLFISHNLLVTQYISNRIAVLYLGRIVEIAPAPDLSDKMLHPYTKILISAIPVPDPKIERAREEFQFEGEVASAITPPSGCHFHPRCPDRKALCTQAPPPLREIEKEHLVACHLFC